MKKQIASKDAHLKALIYSSFKQSKDSIDNSRKQYETVLAPVIKYTTLKNAITNTRLYMDVAIPTVVNMSYNYAIDTTDNYVDFAVNGLEYIIQSYNSSVLGYRNTMEMDMATLSNEIDGIYRKNDTRIMYQFVGNV
jgi:hypothetical protein